MDSVYFYLLLAPAILILISLPLMLGKVKPNGLYGFRTKKTLSNERIWYKANKFTGWALVLSSIITGALILVMRSSETTYNETALFYVFLPIIIGIVIAAVYVKTLK